MVCGGSLVFGGIVYCHCCKWHLVCVRLKRTRERAASRDACDLSHHCSAVYCFSLYHLYLSLSLVPRAIYLIWNSTCSISVCVCVVRTHSVLNGMKAFRRWFVKCIVDRLLGEHQSGRPGVVAARKVPFCCAIIAHHLQITTCAAAINGVHKQMYTQYMFDCLSSIFCLVIVRLSVQKFASNPHFITQTQMEM